MRLWAGGKYLLMLPGHRPACGTANETRSNNVRKLLITNSPFTNDIRFLYFPPFATSATTTVQRQNLSLCLVLTARKQPIRAGGKSCCTNAWENFYYREQALKKMNIFYKIDKGSCKLDSIFAKRYSCISSSRYRHYQLLPQHKYLISVVG